jgi:NADH dehydrogenase FAD-containing subunit
MRAREFSQAAPVEQARQLHEVVVVGAGAGGLELVTRLGDRRGRRGGARITLIEKERAHFWKPHLHELAAGSMDLASYETNYLAQSHWHGFHAIRLDTPSQAARFHRRLVNACIRAQAQAGPLRPGQLQVALIGAGATGVELAAELHRTTRTLVSYGLDRIDPDKDIRLILLEASPRILPALPERLAKAAALLLERLGVHVRTSSRVHEVLPDGIRLASGEIVPAELVVWAAGVKAPEFLSGLGGLEANAINQLVVTACLQTTRDSHVLAGCISAAKVR